MKSPRAFYLLWAGQTISVLGSMIGRTALPFTAILALGATPVQMGWLAAADLAPRFLVGLFAGAWVDRLPRRPVLIATDLGRALLLASIPVAAGLGRLSLAHLYLVQALVGVLTMFFDAAYPAYLPSLVGREGLLAGNARLTGSAAVAEVVGFGLSGWLVEWFTGPLAVGLDSLSFVVSALFLVAIRAREPAPGVGEAAAARSMAREIGDGLREVRAQPVLRALAAATAGRDLAFGLVTAVILYYTTRTLGFSTGAQGLIFAVGGIASFFGALAAPRLGARLGSGPAMILGLFAGALGSLFLPLARGATPAGTALLVAQQVVADPGYTIYEVHAVTTRQAVTPDALLGRVNATLRCLGLAAMLAGTQVGGFLGERAGPRIVLFAAVAAILLAALRLLLSPVRGLTGRVEAGAE